MPQSYYKIWLHVVFSTKCRLPLIEPRVERQIHDHMREQLIELGCPVRIINGMSDHVHLLFLHNPRMTIADVVKQVKGNTSHWINKNDLTQFKFSWQDGYGAFSVSESQLERVFQYIRNQKQHHAKKLFSQEYDEFIAAHGLVKEKETA
ncbi:IS200/IS605 family transposase [Aurantibacillus circumpalustris]|uniref:IS200/IS605 family transposase n=1 Tax=Aurantibacillus circumpalustris TaxID=3036359 RepID=UPI00295C3993|nr:IS200/IS605 family transposase [Aurantibacillus circumpalustris]